MRPHSFHCESIKKNNTKKEWTNSIAVYSIYWKLSFCPKQGCNRTAINIICGMVFYFLHFHFAIKCDSLWAWLFRDYYTSESLDFECDMCIDVYVCVEFLTLKIYIIFIYKMVEREHDLWIKFTIFDYILPTKSFSTAHVCNNVTPYTVSAITMPMNLSIFIQCVCVCHFIFGEWYSVHSFRSITS